MIRSAKNMLCTFRLFYAAAVSILLFWALMTQTLEAVDINPIVIIPVRLGATRLPRKPLQELEGVPMVVRTLKSAQAAAGSTPVIVAADSEKIARVVEKAGGVCVLTDPDLPSGSDRAWVALKRYDPEGQYDTIISVQGDMPVFEPIFVRALKQALERLPDADIVTPVVRREARWKKPQNVACVVSDYSVMPIDIQREPLKWLSSRAHYFTRHPVPYGGKYIWQHVGIYGYRRQALKLFVKTAPVSLEKTESLEQLRALTLGLRVYGIQLDAPLPVSVDVPDDVPIAERAVRDAAASKHPE